MAQRKELPGGYNAGWISEIEDLAKSSPQAVAPEWREFLDRRLESESVEPMAAGVGASSEALLPPTVAVAVS